MPQEKLLEDATVMLAERTWDYDDFAWLLGLLAGVNVYEPPSGD